MASTRIKHTETGDTYSDDEAHEHSWEYEYSTYSCTDCGEIVEGD